MAGQQYDSIVHRFLDVDGGVIVYLSEDQVFTRALRNIVSRVIGLRGEILFPFTSPNSTMEKCLELRDSNVPTVLFVERLLEGRPTTDFIIRLRKEFPAISIVVLSWEITQEIVAYYFELGVSRVLLKPASANKVIEELAGAINPPSELKRLMDRCQSFLDRSDFDEALEVTDRILLLKPNSARGLVMRGDALMGIGESDKAVESFMAAHESRPIFMAPLIKLASAFKDMEDDRALEYLKELDGISPLNPERKIDIAEVHLKRNETEKAEAYLDRSVEVAESEELSMVSDLTERIVDAVAAQAPDLAVKYLNRVIDTKRVLGRDDLVHFNRLGIILRGEGKWQEAVKTYEKALAIVQDDPAVHYNMGLAFWEGNERMRALRCFEQALELDSDFFKGSVGVALNIGSLYLDLRQYRDAEPFFEHVLELDPQNKTAQKRLKNAHNRIPPKGSEPASRSGSGSYDVDNPSFSLGRKSQPAARKGSSATFNVDAMAGKPAKSSKPSKKSSGTSFNVDEMAGDKPKAAKPTKSKSDSAISFDVDNLEDSLSGSSKKKKKSKSTKVTKLDF